MIIPASASVAATTRTARIRGPLRAPSARGAVLRLVTVSLPFLRHVVAGVDRSLCAVATPTSAGDRINPLRSLPRISLPVVTHEGARAALVANDRHPASR